jgi:uracil-DNA glycosylase family 4
MSGPTLGRSEQQPNDGSTTSVVRKHPLAKCEDCPLAGRAGQFVPSSGPQKAELAFVGEAPGAQEARKGVPFTGPSGKLLDSVNKHHGINREEVFLTNACLCRPSDNSTPPPAAISACRERLVSELANRGVSTVVALGNSACQSLLGVSGVTKLRVGPGRTSDYLPGVRVIPTLHPAAALRQADLFPYIATDIGKVKAPHVVWNPPDITVIDSELDAVNLFAKLRRQGVEEVVVDIEVDIEKDTAHDHPNHYGMLCVGLATSSQRAYVLSEGAMESDRVRSELGGFLRDVRIIAQNGKFDLAGLYPILGGLELWFDTMLASYVFDERPGIHGLKHMAVEYLGAPQYDDEIKRYLSPRDGYGVIPRDILYRYNAYDVACTYALYEMFSARFDSDKDGAELRRAHDYLVAASNQLMYLELNGIGVDIAYLDKLTHEYLGRLESIEGDIRSVVAPTISKAGNLDPKGQGLNPRSPQQVTKYLALHQIKTDTTNEDTLKLMLEHPFVQKDAEVVHFLNLLLKHRREAKLYGTYVKGIRNRLYGGRVFSSYLLHGSTTGRLASRNPNLQNIPRESSIRRLFVPAKEGNVFVHVDYSQAELRVLCYLAQDRYFRDIFNGGERDLFDELTPVLYPGRTKENTSAADWKELRIRVKAYVYGLAYGREAGSIAEEYGLSRGEAVDGMNRFFDVIPEIVQFREDTRASVLAGNDLVTPYGRHRRFALITKENIHNVMNEALAFLPQSTASDMTLGALVVLRPELKGVAYIRNIIHDALLLECAEEDAEEVAALTSKRMIESAERVVGDYVKFATDYKVGASWGDV